jgi:hypothetical protein
MPSIEGRIRAPGGSYLAGFAGCPEGDAIKILLRRSTFATFLCLEKSHPPYAEPWIRCYYHHAGRGLS